jgi:Mg-chelatase subunit ChlI
MRRQPSGWDVRRRVVAVALAAALVLAPATMASAAALPGQAMYPFKRAIEEIRVASVQWSPSREASERTRIADVRRDELAKLTQLEMFNQIEPAVNALTSAVLAAKRAVAEARLEGVAPSELAALAGRLNTVEGRVDQTFVVVASALEAAPGTAVSREMRLAALDAVNDSREVLDPHGTPSTPGPPVTTPEPKESEKPPPPSDAGGSNPQPDPTQASTPPEPSQPSESTQTTQEPVTTTTAPEPTTTTEPATPGSLEGAGPGTSPGRSTDDLGVTPTTTLPAP